MAERLDRFMARANAAYYATHDPFADFVTAPELGQVFGELLGAWAVVVWRQMGCPRAFRLIEAGPGRGTLMQDMLRLAARVAPDFHAAASVHLIETSARLRAEQALRVPQASWHMVLADVPRGPLILIANEFLDALPVRQFILREHGWRERFVQDGAFQEEDAADPGIAAQPGCVVERHEAAQAWIGELCPLLLAGGAALILDYGSAETAPGDSLQALRGGKPADPLRDPGSADLTAHVDFAGLSAVARRAGAQVWGPVPQGVFLGQLGLGARTAQLAAANPHRAEALYDASSRLAATSRMGALFKAICLTRPGAAAPPGFA